MASDSKTSPSLEERRAACRPFLPPAIRGKQGLRDKFAALRNLPLEKLPLALCPRKKRSFRPPVFYLGYFVDDEWAMRIAKENGFFHTKKIGLHGEREKWDENYAAVFDFILKTTGITTIRLKFEAVTWPPGHRHGWLLAIQSNYRHSVSFGSPTTEDIDRLRQFLGEKETPKWWLSAVEWYWGYRPYLLIG